MQVLVLPNVPSSKKEYLMINYILVVMKEIFRIYVQIGYDRFCRKRTIYKIYLLGESKDTILDFYTQV
jgi:hypothetical protein